jgi:glycosyltransferase involved in cell wall biosynthesis
MSLERPMKVLHVIPSIAFVRGGPSVVVRTMARYLVQRGLEVDIATTDDNGRERLLVDQQLPLREDGVVYWIFPRQTRFYQMSIPLTRWLRKHVCEYDLVHIHALFSYASVASAFFAKSAGVPYVVRPLGTLNQWGMRNRHRFLKKMSFRLIESHILRGAARVQFTSEQEALEARLLSIDHNPIVIANPVEPSLLGVTRGGFRAAHPELDNRTIVLFLSRLDTKKGLDLLLPAFARVLRNHQDAILIIAGDGDATFVADLKEQARQLGIDSGIIWAGFLRGEAKDLVLADADVFVLPSYSENFGVAVVEAMGAGIPVIVSDQVGIHREVSGAEAGLVVQCVREQLEIALIKMITDRQLRTKMGRNARELACQFAPEIVTDQLMETYAGICNNHGAPVAA